ncbi:minor capsid protein [Aneurinibacillus thermoaerophilus]|uniref:Phage putative head morphogenesis protein, SPP1 gp7 family n=1 Tax=Aneurinibacillus thermoaerophilus TaxID=143495 RepID=A0A1G8ENL4_ANETH|nr:MULTISPECIES: minor capsid protein [Aneurinibacillus]AMA72919.1 hypothetical protein ACH33_08650 [Aneurinibacillus sp. XH2]MED0758657.1 minor capsid protein [Aneurinibacillus thermoaerophilus]MED0761047.1 minor capsid protein [Aneurinibacillus thermoaerophilus]SDH71279.1 phage putative head morphogenesis protein, SPP1 gp7 family [Aneurinibacillus thermoaerophilus]
MSEEKVTLPSPEYWAKRMEEITEADMTRTAEVEKKIAKAYQKAQREIIKQIEAFVARYASENGMTYQQAIVYLNRDEFRQWRMNIEEFVERIEKTGDQLLLLELNTLSARSRITRLEQLLMQINVQLAELKQEQEEVLEEHFIESAAETYYQTTFAVQQGIGMATTVAVLDTQAIQMILTMPWSGANYSERIWKDRQRLTQVLEEELVQHFIQAKDIRQTSKAVAERMEASYANAVRLVRTESSYVVNQATMKAYENTGFIEEYEFLATLDRKTSKVCQQQDGKRYKLSDAVVGVNYPPLHPHCRSTTVPVVTGSKVSERLARDAKGNAIKVPATMDYKEWYNKVIDGNTLKLADPSRYSKEYTKKLYDTFDYFKEHGHIFKEHALNRVLGQKKGKDKRSFTKEDVLDVLKNGKKYFQEEGDKTVFFKDGIAVVRANDTNEIVSIVTRPNPKKEWREIDE